VLRTSRRIDGAHLSIFADYFAKGKGPFLLRMIKRRPYHFLWLGLLDSEEAYWDKMPRLPLTGNCQF
jgi:hypothetical protein